MKILITGSQGRIGRWLVQTLTEAGHTLRTLDSTTQANNLHWEHLDGDVRNLSFVRMAVQGMDAVVHLAAILTDTPGDEERLYTVNLQGTWNLLIACVQAGVSRLVNFSSLQALGHSAKNHTALSLPLDDWIPKQPVTNYQISKHAGEELCTGFASQYGLVVASLRPTFVSVPDPEADIEWRKLPEETRAGYATRDYWSFVDVRDVCQAVQLALTAPLVGHQAFLLASDYTHARLPTVELAQKYYTYLPWKVTPEEWAKDNTYRGLIDCRRAKEVLGWRPENSQRETILGEV